MEVPLILTLDDDPDMTAILCAHLRRWGYREAAVGSASELWRKLAESIPDVLLMDVFLGDADGSELVARVKERLPHLPVIMITRSTSLEAAVRSMKRGATDYITKPVDFDRLRRAVDDALEAGRVVRQAAELPEATTPPDSPVGPGRHGIVGHSTPMLRLFQLVENLAPTDASALILGETGTGKELVARAIHGLSSRQEGPFVAVNAAAIPHELIESALFGHEKGAFTGAQNRHTGFCEQADGGTLFLDEIAEMDIGVQAKLLRFLQDHEVQRVGARSPRKVDVRILAATNVDPVRQIAEGRLREDLYYRLRVVSLRIPPLRERPGDLFPLADHLLRQASERHGGALTTIAPGALALLESYPWPGNVRELENVLQEAAVLHRGTELTAEMLPEEISQPASGSAAAQLAAGTNPDTSEGASLSPREHAERRRIAEALDRADDQPEEAADDLGISRATIYRKIKKYGLR